MAFDWILSIYIQLYCSLGLILQKKNTDLQANCLGSGLLSLCFKQLFTMKYQWSSLPVSNYGCLLSTTQEKWEKLLKTLGQFWWPWGWSNTFHELLQLQTNLRYKIQNVYMVLRPKMELTSLLNASHSTSSKLPFCKVPLLICISNAWKWWKVHDSLSLINMALGIYRMIKAHLAELPCKKKTHTLFSKQLSSLL